MAEDVIVTNENTMHVSTAFLALTHLEEDEVLEYAADFVRVLRSLGEEHTQEICVQAVEETMKNLSIFEDVLTLSLQTLKTKVKRDARCLKK